MEDKEVGSELLRAKKMTLADATISHAVELAKTLDLSPRDMIDAIARGLVAVTASHAVDGGIDKALDGVVRLFKHHADSLKASVSKEPLN